MTKDKIFIIAEISANHNNDKNLLLETVKAIADSGADAVKVQTYKPQSLTLNMDTGYFKPRKYGMWKGYTSWDLYSQASLPYEWHHDVKQLCDSLGIIFFSSPFDIEAVDFLKKMNVPMYKIASLEITDLPLISYVASIGKPIIISTGVAEIEDISNAINACKKVGNNQITLLKCTSEYPAKISNANLLTINDMRDRFDVDVGISDHTFGKIVPLVSVSLGITVIEKHFTLDRSKKGPDSDFSMEPDEFKDMVESVRLAETSLGKINYNVSDHDKLRRRSLFISKDISKGEKFTKNNIKSIRPGNGIHPKFFNDIIGKTAKYSLKKGDPLTFDFIK